MIYFENKVFIFDNKKLFVFDKKTNIFKEIRSDKVKGKLLYMNYATSTVVNNKVINTGEEGTYAFYPKELICKLLNKNLSNKYHTASLLDDGTTILYFGGTK